MTKQAEHRLEQGVLMPVALNTLCASAVLGFDLYLASGNPAHPVLYRQRTYPVTQNDLDQLLSRGVRTLYISSQDTDAYRTHLRNNILKNEDISPAQRYAALCEAARDVLSERFRR